MTVTKIVRYPESEGMIRGRKWTARIIVAFLALSFLGLLIAGKLG